MHQIQPKLAVKVYKDIYNLEMHVWDISAFFNMMTKENYKERTRVLSKTEVQELTSFPNLPTTKHISRLRLRFFSSIKNQYYLPTLTPFNLSHLFKGDPQFWTIANSI